MMNSVRFVITSLVLINFLSADAFAQAKKKKTKVDTKALVEKMAPAATTSNEPVKLESPAPGVRVAPGEVLNFKTDTPDANNSNSQSGPAPTYNFSDGSGDVKTTPLAADTIGEEVPYKAYIGYPKHKITVLAEPKNVAAKWEYSGRPFNFRSNTVAYGLGYQFVANPRFSVGVDYQRYELQTNAETINSTLSVENSKKSFDVYMARLRYCFFGDSNFFKQLCPGFDIGNDAYPILAFTGNTTLAMNQVQDLVAGVNFTYQAPVNEQFMFVGQVGYNYGLGVGQTGTLASKSNSSYFLRLGATYELNGRHSLGSDVNFRMRNAKIEGYKGSVKETWTTQSNDLGLRLYYTYSM